MSEKCNICGKAPGAPYRVYDARGKVISGCIGDAHTGHIVTPSESSAWHNRPEAKAYRAASAKRIKMLTKKNSIKPSRKTVTAKIKFAVKKRTPAKKLYSVYTSAGTSTWHEVNAGLTLAAAKKQAYALYALHPEKSFKVDPSSPASIKWAKDKRPNPATDAEARAAAKLSHAFTGRKPHNSEYKSVPMPRLPKAMAAIGKIEAIEYIALRDGKEYIFRHQFKASSRPHLAVSPDGKIATMIGGSWIFTEDGFEDQ